VWFVFAVFCLLTETIFFFFYSKRDPAFGLNWAAGKDG
jgi:hypothetical protein